MAVRRAIVVAFWIAVAAVGVLAAIPGESLPLRLFNIWDKAQHASAFAVMSTLGILGYRTQWLRVVFGLLIFGILIELMQSFIPWRSCEVLDVVADAVGVGMGILFCYYFVSYGGIYSRR